MQITVNGYSHTPHYKNYWKHSSSPFVPSSCNYSIEHKYLYLVPSEATLNFIYFQASIFVLIGNTLYSVSEPLPNTSSSKLPSGFFVSTISLYESSRLDISIGFSQ